MTEEDEATRKKAVFDGLYALDNDSEGEEDIGLLASLNRLQGKTLGDPTVPPPRRSKRTPGHLSRSLSALSPAHPIRSEQLSTHRRTSARQLLEEASIVKDTPVLQTRHTIIGIEALNQYTSEANMPPSSGFPPHSSGPPPSSAIPRVGKGKRKRDADIKTVPEAQQIFRNLHFYFFPNSDTDTGRGMRIIKAIEWGASWQKEFNDSVTHIIADKDMKYEHIKKHLKLDRLPDGVILVNEKYPASCLDFRKLIDTSASEFGVEGYVAPKAILNTEVPKNITQQSDTSLKLRPARKSLTAPAQETPSRSGESSPEKTASQEKREETDVDELDMAIREAKEAERLGLDPSDHEEDIAEDGPSGAEAGFEGNKRHKTSAWQERFQCMHKHTGDNDQGPNIHIISILQELADYYTSTKDEWRSRSYRQAIAALRSHPTRVTTKAEAQKIHNIGDSIAEKIEEIVETNRLRKLDCTKLDERQQILQVFMKIYGVGFSVAEKWVSAGHKTIDDLLRSAELTANQRIGIEHYEDFNTRIPRAEVEQHSNIVSSALKKLDSAYRVYTMGSYRRGAESSGDIDVIITKPGAKMEEIRSTVLDRLVPTLTKSNFLVAALAQTSQADGSKWHGASCLPTSKIWRRIDLLLVPEAEIGAALIYFTGNDIFNRSLRLLASRKNMRLNQRGLYKDVLRDRRREKISEGTLVEGKSERKIFEALGVPWRPPEHRIC